MEKNVLLNIVGDVCLKNITNDNYAFSENVKEVFSKGDFNLANLECALTYSDEKLKYQPIHLKGNPELNVVVNTFDIYSLANNHVMDYKAKGLYDTIDFLENNNKSYFGAGKNEYDALRPLLLEKNGIKIAFFSFTRYNNASKRDAGTAPEKFRFICSEIKRAKQSNYFVIVYPHWNYQWIDYPAPDERKKGHRMIDAGADLVIGAHPHIVQGYEIYNGKYIFHSLGNFIFKNTKYTKPIPQFGQSIILTIEVNGYNNYTTKITSVFNDNDGVRLMTKEENKIFENKIDAISSKLTVNSEVRKLFYESASQVEKNNKFVFGELKKDGGFKALFSAYRIVNFQDFKRKFYSLARN